MPETHSDGDISLRIAPGTLGFYTHVEVTEIFVVRDARLSSDLNLHKMLISLLKFRETAQRLAADRS